MAAAEPNLHAYKRVKISSLKAYDRNARLHSPEQIEQIRNSIRQFGFTNPVLIDENAMLIAGHGRVRAAEAEGLSIIPAIEVKGLTPEQKATLVIADNQLALNATWDPELLLKELGSLSEDMVRIAGFDDAEIGKLTALVENIALTDAETEWTGMPEFTNAAIAFRSVIVHFKCAEDVAEFFKLIGQVPTDKTKSVWHPAVERDTAPKQYETASA